MYTDITQVIIISHALIDLIFDYYYQNKDLLKETPKIIWLVLLMYIKHLKHDGKVWEECSTKEWIGFFTLENI